MRVNGDFRSFTEEIATIHSRSHRVDRLLHDCGTHRRAAIRRALVPSLHTPPAKPSQADCVIAGSPP